MGNEDAAHDCLADLGKLGVLQFTDLNPELTPFQRRYVSYVKRCDELERKLRFFNAGIEKFGLESAPAGSIEAFLSTSIGTTKQDPGAALGRLEQETDTYEAQLKELNSYNEKLTHEFNEKVEYQEVLEKSLEFFTFEEGGETGKRLDIVPVGIPASSLTIAKLKMDKDRKSALERKNKNKDGADKSDDVAMSNVD